MSDHIMFAIVTVGLVGLVGAVFFTVRGWILAERRADRLEHEVMLKDALLAQAGAPDRMQP